MVTIINLEVILNINIELKFIDVSRVVKYYAADYKDNNNINILNDKGNNYCVYIYKGDDDENDNDNKK